MSVHKKILCIGQINADVIFSPVEQVIFDPNSNESTQMMDRCALRGGGCASNTAVNLAHLGADVSLVGAVGRDAFGEEVCQWLNTAGVNTEHVLRTDNHFTGTAAVLVHPSTERRFLYHLGANQTLTPEKVPADRFSDYAIVHVGGALLLPGLDGASMAAMFRQAKAAGAVTSMDLSNDSAGGWLERLHPCLPYVDHFLPSFDEAYKLTGLSDVPAMADALLAMGAGSVVIKLGSKGCYTKNKDTAFYTSAYRIQAVDTNGAGDAFVAGFLMGLSEDVDIACCTQFGCAAGAITATAMGATNEVLTRPHLEQFMREQQG